MIKVICLIDGQQLRFIACLMMVTASVILTTISKYFNPSPYGLSVVNENHSLSFETISLSFTKSSLVLRGRRLFATGEGSFVGL